MLLKCHIGLSGVDSFRGGVRTVDVVVMILEGSLGFSKSCGASPTLGVLDRHRIRGFFQSSFLPALYMTSLWTSMFILTLHAYPIRALEASGKGTLHISQAVCRKYFFHVQGSY